MLTTATQINCILQPGVLNQVLQLVTLNQKWQRANLANEEPSFLSVVYNEGIFQAVVANRNVIVLHDEANGLQGYVLVNTVLQQSFDYFRKRYDCLVSTSVKRTPVLLGHIQRAGDSYWIAMKSIS